MVGIMTTPQTLEEKLRAIVSELMLNEHEWYDQHKANAVAQILQAFEEAGYIKVTGTQEQQAALANMMLGNKVMTGQEFYIRFKAELASEVFQDNVPQINGQPSDVHVAVNECILAVKRAAGVSDE
jgi:hypothetical protein